jgi:hypothetical protein
MPGVHSSGCAAGPPWSVPFGNKRSSFLCNYIMRASIEHIFLPRPILVRSGTLGYADSAAVLKDISAAGAYFLTLMPLARGEVVEL